MTRTCAARLLGAWWEAAKFEDQVQAARYEERIIAAMMYAPDGYHPTLSGETTTRIVEDAPPIRRPVNDAGEPVGPRRERTADAESLVRRLTEGDRQ